MNQSKRQKELILSNQYYSSINSDVSTSSTSSTSSSIELLLESRRENPFEILLGLGFGHNNDHNKSYNNEYSNEYCSFNNQLKRIPARFFQQKSSAKGVNIKNMKLLRDNIDCCGEQQKLPQTHSSYPDGNYDDYQSFYMHLLNYQQSMANNSSMVYDYY